MLKKACKSDLTRVSLLLLVGLGILFWQVPLLGYVQVPADLLPYYDPVMRDGAPTVSPPQNGLLSDHISQFYVWHQLAAEAMQRTGKIPLWNPNILAGQPLVANAQPALIYPPNWLLFCCDPGLVTAIRSVFNLFVAGLFTFLFSRALQVSRSGATLAAIAFAFSGALIVGPSHAYANCLVWLPFTLWAAERMIGRSRVYFWGLVMSVGIGLSALGGHPESTFHNLLVVAVYTLVRIWSISGKTRVKMRLVAAFSMALLVGMLLGAIQWLPFAVWLQSGAKATMSRGVAFRAESPLYASEWLSNLATIPTLIFPSLFGNPVENTYRWPFPTFQNYLEQSMYFGLVPAALAAGVLVSSGRPRWSRLTIIAILAVVLLAVGLRLPGFEIFHHLPVFEQVNNTRLKWYFSLMGAVLAGFGLDRLSNSPESRPGHRRLFWRSMTVILGASTAMAALIVASKLLSATTSLFPESSFVKHLLDEIFSWGHPKAIVSLLTATVAFGAVVFFSRRQQPSDRTHLKGLVITLTFVELVTLAYGYNTLVPREAVFPAVRLTETLGQDTDTYRIMGQPPAFWPNYGAVYGLYHVGGYDLPVFGRYAEVYEAQGGTGYRQKWSADWPLVDWMNIKYVVTTQELALDKFELIYAGEYRLYRNKNVLPRAYVIYDAQVVEDDASMMAALTSGSFPFERMVLLESALSAEQATALAGPSEAAASQRVTFASYENDRVEIDVATAAPGLLVMSDVDAPGWIAKVDGRPAELLRANYAFRSVFVPAGEHRVTFAYEPWDFKVGSLLSLVALVLLGLGLPLLWVTTGPKPVRDRVEG